MLISKGCPIHTSAQSSTGKCTPIDPLGEWGDMLGARHRRSYVSPRRQTRVDDRYAQSQLQYDKTDYNTYNNTVKLR